MLTLVFCCLNIMATKISATFHKITKLNARDRPMTHSIISPRNCFQTLSAKVFPDKNIINAFYISVFFGGEIEESLSKILLILLSVLLIFTGSFTLSFKRVIRRRGSFDNLKTASIPSQKFKLNTR